MFECRMLGDSDLAEVIRTMQSGFSDYIISVNINEEGYRNKFALEGVDLSHSIAVFDGVKMIGATVNGIGHWHGSKCAYDAGTVVLPEYRRKGVSKQMFDHLIPELKSRGFEKYLLEVIATNEPALELYQKLGFSRKRRLGVYKRNGSLVSEDCGESFMVRPLSLDEVIDNEMFSDDGLTWQNSNDWIRRAFVVGYPVRFMGAEIDGRLAGIGAIAPNSGKVQRIIVERKYRGVGIGRRIVTELANKSKKALQFINVDLAEEDSIAFLKACGFEKTVEQFEMELLFV